jgi:hypothetical protein
MSLTKQKVDNNTEKIIYNNKPATLSGIVSVKDLSKKGWVVIDCSTGNKISKGLSNIANQLNIKLNVNNLYCKYTGDTILNENQKYDIVAELLLSKGTTLYGKINKLNHISSTSNITLSDSLTITNKDKTSSPWTTSQPKQQENITSQNITLSDETINKIKVVTKEAFSEVLKESTKNLSMLVEVIKELTLVIDKNSTVSQSNKNKHNVDIPFNEDKSTNIGSPNISSKIDNKHLFDESSDDIPNDLVDNLSHSDNE